MPTPWRWVVGSWLVGTLALAGGCARQPRVESAAVDHRAPPLPRADESFAPVKTAAIFPFAAQSGRYAVLRGARAGQTIPFRLEPADEGMWRWQVEGIFASFYRRQEDGSIVCPREEDLREQVALEYDPPLLVLPAVVRAGESYRGRSRVVVRSLRNNAVRDQGDVRWRLEPIEAAPLETPAGTFETYRVRYERDMRLRLATVRVVALTGYAPGKGLVMEQTSESLRAMGLFQTQREEEMRLAP